MKALLISLILGFVIFSVPSLSQELEHYEVAAEINSDLSVRYSVNMIFFNTSFNTFTYKMDDGSYNSNVTSSSDSVSCKVLKTDVACDISKAEKRFSVTIDYSLKGEVKKQDKYFIYETLHRVPTDSGGMLITVKLPEGYAMMQKQSNGTFPSSPYLPSFGTVGTDGRRIILVWNKDNIKAGDGLAVSVNFEQIAEPYPLRMLTGGIIGLIIIIVLLVVGFFVFWKRFKGIRAVFPVLKKDEKIIMDVLLKYKGEANQKAIVKESNYSKAKVSKVLKSLVERGLISLERIGRTNKVFLVKELKKEEQKDKGNN